MRQGDLPDPTPSSGEVLVPIQATAINSLDGKIQNGEFKPILPYKSPFVLDHDLARNGTADETVDRLLDRY